MADLNTLFNLGVKKRPLFVDNGKTLQFDQEYVLHDYTPGTYDQIIFPDGFYDPDDECIYLTARVASSHAGGFNGYIGFFKIPWTGSTFGFTELDPICPAEPDTHILTNAAVCKLTSGRILAIYAKLIAGGTVRMRFVRHKDPGGAWSAERVMTNDYPPDGMIDGVNSPIQLPSGRVLIASYARLEGSASTRKGPVYYSDDEGMTWTELSTMYPQFNYDGEEPALLRRQDDGLIIGGVRSDPDEKYKQCYSTDAGVTWSALDDKFDSHGKNPLAETPNGTIFTLGRGNQITEINRALISWSTDGGDTYNRIYADSRSTSWYLYGKTLWFPPLNKAVFIWASVPDDGNDSWVDEPSIMLLHTYNEVDA